MFIVRLRFCGLQNRIWRLNLQLQIDEVKRETFQMCERIVRVENGNEATKEIKLENESGNIIVKVKCEKSKGNELDLIKN